MEREKKAGKIHSPSLKFSRQPGQKKQRNIQCFGFSLMSDGCDNLLQLPYPVMFAACAVFS